MRQTHIGAVTAGVLAAGPLQAHGERFAAHLLAIGYTPATVRAKLTFLAQMSRWLERRGLRFNAIDEDRVRAFLIDRRHLRRSRAAAEATIHQLLRYARVTHSVRHVKAKRPRDAAARTEAAYREYLLQERALARVTIDSYVGLVRPFLSERSGSALCARDVVRFVMRRSSGMGPGRAKLLVTALRSLLRFLQCTGRTQLDLASCVPTVADWRHGVLPKFIPATDVRRIIRTCDRGTARGRRDHAVLLVLARLGLRAGEVVRMTLDDIDWDAGELVVRGKGSRLDRVPIPSDVGDALVTYLRDRHVGVDTRRFFLTARAPRQGFSSPAAVSTIVRRAIDRCGLTPPSKGAHLLRHSLATDLLRRGASLAEIGELLRHRSPDTTMIYAKVDFAALRELAQPWPGGDA